MSFVGWLELCSFYSCVYDVYSKCTHEHYSIVEVSNFYFFLHFLRENVFKLTKRVHLQVYLDLDMGTHNTTPARNHVF